MENERYIIVSDDEYCYTLDTQAENHKTLDDFEKIEFEQAEKDNVDINEYEDAILESAYDKYWEWVYLTYIECDTVNDILNRSYDEIKDLKDKITEIKQDEHQLSLSFLEYKQKVQKTLQKHYNNEQEYDMNSCEIIEAIANDLGVELE